MTTQNTTQSTTVTPDSSGNARRKPLPPNILSLSNAAFGELLKERLEQRSIKDGSTYYLDFRAAKLGNLGRVTLLDPVSAGWPHRGSATTVRGTAEKWAKDPRVVKHFRDRIKLRITTPGTGRLSVRDAAEDYVRSLLRTRMVEVTVDGVRCAIEEKFVPRKFRSRVSCIRRHVIPVLGDNALDAISVTLLRETADAATTEKNVRDPKTGMAIPGKYTEVPAAYGTKENIIRAVSAIWRHTYRDTPPPFAGAVPTPAPSSGEDDSPPEVDANAEIIQGTNGALLPAELVAALTGAMYRDANLAARANLVGVIEPTTAHAIALQACLGARISELMTIQWRHVNLVRGWVYVRNAKKKQVLVEARAVPIQESLVPWLYDLWLMALAEHRRRTGRPLEYGPFPLEDVGKELPTAFVIRTNARAPLTKRGATTTLGNKLGLAQEIADVKKPGKETHGFRATFASYADMAPGLSTRDMQRYLGHHVHKGSTERYVAQMVRDMTPEHRRIVNIPTPEQIRSMVGAFKPASLPEWDKRKRVRSRSMVARAAHQARGPRTVLGVSLDLPIKVVHAEVEFSRRKRPKLVQGADARSTS